MKTRITALVALVASVVATSAETNDAMQPALHRGTEKRHESFNKLSKANARTSSRASSLAAAVLSLDPFLKLVSRELNSSKSTTSPTTSLTQATAIMDFTLWTQNDK